MKRHEEADGMPTIDYGKKINVDITVGELMMINATFGESTSEDNVKSARKEYTKSFVDYVTEEDIGLSLFLDARKILREEGVE